MGCGLIREGFPGLKITDSLQYCSILQMNNEKTDMTISY